MSILLPNINVRDNNLQTLLIAKILRYTVQSRPQHKNTTTSTTPTTQCKSQYAH